MILEIFKWAYIDVDEGGYDTLDDKAARLKAEGIPHEYREGKYGSLEIEIKPKILHKLYLNNVITTDEYDNLNMEKVDYITIE